MDRWMVDRKMDDERVISCLITGSHRDWYVEHGRAHVYVFLPNPW